MMFRYHGIPTLWPLIHYWQDIFDEDQTPLLVVKSPGPLLFPEIPLNFP